MLYIIGIGLCDEKDITLRGLEAVKSSDEVFLEAYTSILSVGADALSEFYGKKVVVADRETVEMNAEMILENAKDKTVSFLVVGDAFCATTHHDLMKRAIDRGIEVKKIYNASVMNAIGSCGLQLYRFGQCITMVFFTETWRPDSWYEKVKANRGLGLHTLVLLDIKVKEQSIENLARGRKIYEPPRYMTASECARQLLEIEGKRQEGVYSPSTLCVAVARLGHSTEKMVAATLEEIAEYDMGAPLHSLVIPGELSEFETEMMDLIRLKKE